eukprot:457810_1
MLSWYKAGSKCKIDGSVVSNVSTSAVWNCAYGTQEVSSGKHEWKVKVINDSGGGIMIGITSNTKWAESSCWSKADTYCYLYYGADGRKFDKSGSGTAYSQSCTTNDAYVMTVLVDFDEHTIAFAKNG